MTKDPPQIEILVNGDRLRVPAGFSVADLLQLLEIRPGAIAVEINREIQPADGFAQRTLHHGDALEVVTLVGGG